jgi:hypothetical protein
MSVIRHSVCRENLDVIVSDEELAFALQPRLAELNRMRLLPAIERILDEIDVPGRHLLIDRLDLDLGTFSFAHLEDEAESRLVRALRDSLLTLVNRIEGGNERHARALSDAEAKRELLMLYLLHGTWRHWAPERRSFSLEELFLELASNDPEGLVTVVREAGQHDYVLERIAAQLSDETIRELIRLLEPRQAVLILDYVDDLRGVHRLQPLLPLSDRELARVVWVIVEAYLVQDPGSQFNRKTFVRSMLEGLVASEGLDYAQILIALRVGLRRTESRYRLHTSLPAVLAELMRDLSEEASAFDDAPSAALRRSDVDPESMASLSDDELRERIASILASDDADAMIRAAAADPHLRERWAAMVTDEQLARIAEVLEPQHHRTLMAAANVLAEAWRETAPPGHPALTEQPAFRGFMLRFLMQKPAEGLSADRLVAMFFEDSAARYLAVAPSSVDVAAHGERLLDGAVRLARNGGHTALVSALRRDARVLVAPWERIRPKTSPKRLPASEPETQTEDSDPIYLDNAGIVLAAPFVPHLFEVLDFVGQDFRGRTALRDPATVSRAVHLLQFLVDGRTSVPEPMLVLNKILCGVPSAVPIAREIEPAEREREACEKVLRSMLAAWTAIGNTSVACMQESFFRREGKLQQSRDGWTLEVQRKTIDFLVDQAPWNRSVIFFAWMPKPLYVSW